MKKITIAAAIVVALAVLAFLTGTQVIGQGPRDGIIRRAAAGTLKPAQLNVTQGGKTTVKDAPFFSNGLLAAAQAALNDKSGGAAGGSAEISGLAPLAVPGQIALSVGCSARTSNGNFRVNQDCTYRRDAEVDIDYNPANVNNLLAGNNDSEVGYNQCGIAFSTDNGRHWGDMIPPFRQHQNDPSLQLPAAHPGDPNKHTIKGGAGTRHTYDVGSDPVMAFGPDGRGYFSCVTFDIESFATGLYATTSPPGAMGAFFLNIPANGPEFIVAEDNSPGAQHDKEFMDVNTFPGTNNYGVAVVTWTVFRFECGPSHLDYCESPIYGSVSGNGGHTWSTPQEISGVNSAFCDFGNFFDPAENAHACNFDQASDPVFLPNGDLVVVFNNGNTPTADNQQLSVRCHPTWNAATKTGSMNCQPPRRVGADIRTGMPFCDFGRDCVPGHYIRMLDGPRIEVNHANSHLYVVWQDYRNKEFDIQMAHSYDGGNTWVNDGTVNHTTGLDHYYPAVDIAEVGGVDRVGVSFYRTERVKNENTTPAGGFPFAATNTCGPNGNAPCKGDYVVAGGTGTLLPYHHIVVSPVFFAPDGNQAGFNGDYTGIVINQGIQAHPIWSDTRNTNPFAEGRGSIRDEDVFTHSVDLPSGQAQYGPGKIGP